MDSFARLIGWVGAVLALWVLAMPFAHAVPPTVSAVPAKWRVSLPPHCTALNSFCLGDSPQEAGSAYAKWAITVNNSYLLDKDPVCPAPTVLSATCTAAEFHESATVTFKRLLDVSVAAYCPTGTLQLVGGLAMCTGVPTCPFDYFLSNGDCVPIPKPKCAESVGKPLDSEMHVAKTSGEARPAGVCAGGCMYVIPSNGWDMSGKSGSAWYHWFNGGQATGTGTECVPDANGGGAAPEPDKPEQVPPGKCPGTVNGTAVFVPCDRTKTSGTSTSSTPPTTTAPGTSPDAPGTKTETETTCVGSRCTTTSTKTTTNPDGSTTTEKGETEESQEQFCSKNPTAAICKKEESAFGGSCGAFTCGGDAIQCAMAREQHRRNCELFEPSEASARGIAAAGAGDRPGDHPGNNKTTVAMGGGFDQTNLLTGSCPGDQTVPIGGGRSVVLPWSKLCSPAALLGNVLVGITALACVGIVFKG